MEVTLKAVIKCSDIWLNSEFAAQYFDHIYSINKVHFCL